MCEREYVCVRERGRESVCDTVPPIPQGADAHDALDGGGGRVNPKPYTPNPAPQTLHSASYTLRPRPKPDTLHPQPKPDTLHPQPKPDTLHPQPYRLCDRLAIFVAGQLRCVGEPQVRGQSTIAMTYFTMNLLWPSHDLLRIDWNLLWTMNLL